MLNTTKPCSDHFGANRIRVLLVLMIWLIACGSLSVQGQTIFGRISGAVRDKQGAAIPNASVALTNSAADSLLRRICRLALTTYW